MSPPAVHVHFPPPNCIFVCQEIRFIFCPVLSVAITHGISPLTVLRLFGRQIVAVSPTNAAGLNSWGHAHTERQPHKLTCLDRQGHLLSFLTTYANGQFLHCPVRRSALVLRDTQLLVSRVLCRPITSVSLQRSRTRDGHVIWALSSLPGALRSKDHFKIRGTSERPPRRFFCTHASLAGNLSSGPICLMSYYFHCPLKIFRDCAFKR